MDNAIDTSYQDHQSLPWSQEIHSSLIIWWKMNQLQKRVDAIVLRIATYNALLWKYHFFVFSSTDRNVLHTKNRTIYIPSALLYLTKNDDQIAFILSHEIAHWENQDIRNNQVPIHRSPGQISEAECLADEKAMEIIERTQYRRVQIEKLLNDIEHIRPVHECSMPINK